MTNLKITRNPYLLFSPFLVLFILFVLKQHNDALDGDEGGYVKFAENLINGFYSPPAPDINLWWGPGYPIILVPFIAVGVPLICITLMNAVFQYLSIVLLFKSMLQFVSFRKAFFFSLFWALCYSSYIHMAFILTEPFTIFLISSLIFCLINAFNGPTKKYLYLSGFIIGYIALTKVIFGYVILFLFLGSVLLWITNRKVFNYRRGAAIMLIALATVSPYLIYTYHITGKVYYFGNSGGMSLYWMSTPYENEYGDWNNENFGAGINDPERPGVAENLKRNHQQDVDEVRKYTGVEKDEAYKKMAVRNIKAHPVKFAKNIMANISNLLFGFPGSYTYQRPLLKIWYFAILFSLMLFCLIPTIINWKRIQYSIRFLLVFAFIFLGGSALVGGYSRQFVIIIPLLLFWIAYIIHESVSVKILFEKRDQKIEPQGK